jgi:hypothetical protein
VVNFDVSTFWALRYDMIFTFQGTSSPSFPPGHWSVIINYEVVLNFILLDLYQDPRTHQITMDVRGLFSGVSRGSYLMIPRSTYL